jgi:hypothetical protein
MTDELVTPREGDDPFIPPAELASRATGVTTTDVEAVRTSISFSEVYLLALSDEGPTAIPDLGLEFDGAGITLRKADGDLIWQIDWVCVTAIGTAERSQLPDGSRGVVLEVATTEPRTHRFIVPAGKPSSIEAAIYSLAAARGLPELVNPRRVPPFTAVMVLCAAVAVITVLLLAAGHVFAL